VPRPSSAREKGEEGREEGTRGKGEKRDGEQISRYEPGQGRTGLGIVIAGQGSKERRRMRGWYV
jgi:hypothetical protein